MDWLTRLFGGWYVVGKVRLRHGTQVCITGDGVYVGRVGCVQGRGSRTALGYGPYTFLVDLGGLCIEVDPENLELVAQRDNLKWE